MPNRPTSIDKLEAALDRLIEDGKKSDQRNDQPVEDAQVVVKVASAEAPASKP